MVATLGAVLMIGLFRWWGVAAVPLLLAWAWVYAGKYVAHLGWTLVGDAIVFKSGWMWRRVTVARFSKIQAVSRLESPFDRRTGMATVKVDTAGAGDAEHAVVIPFLGAETATTLAETLDVQAARTAFRW